MSLALWWRMALTPSATFFFFLFLFPSLWFGGFVYLICLFLSEGDPAASMDVYQAWTPPHVTWGWRGAPSLAVVGWSSISETEPSGPHSTPRMLTCFPCPHKLMVFPGKMLWKLPKHEGGDQGRGFAPEEMPHADRPASDSACSSHHAETQQAHCHTALRQSRHRLLSRQEESDETHRGRNPTSPRGA